MLIDCLSPFRLGREALQVRARPVTKRRFLDNPAADPGPVASVLAWH